MYTQCLRLIDARTQRSVNNSAELSRPANLFAHSASNKLVGMALLVAREFHPHPLLRNNHVMTMASAFWVRNFRLPQAEERHFQVDQESRLLGHCHWQQSKDKHTPLLALVHGLEGSSDSNYMRGIAAKAWSRGFHVIRLNQRNCGGTELLTPTLYNSGMSGDYQKVLEELINADGFTQIFFAGYSMGGNLVTKMAGELGERAPRELRGVAAVCPALNLAACADALERRENYLYQRRFVAGLLSRYARKSSLFPQRYSSDGFGPIRTVREFDDAITAPCFGFRDAQEYYESAGAKRVVPKIRIPYLLITAQDDPFVPYQAIRASGAEENPAIQFLAPRNGGHCAFIANQGGDERFWAEQRVVEFCVDRSENLR